MQHPQIPGSFQVVVFAQSLCVGAFFLMLALATWCCAVGTSEVAGPPPQMLLHDFAAIRDWQPFCPLCNGYSNDRYRGHGDRSWRSSMLWLRRGGRNRKLPRSVRRLAPQPARLPAAPRSMLPAGSCSGRLKTPATLSQCASRVPTPQVSTSKEEEALYLQHVKHQCDMAHQISAWPKAKPQDI